jgi:hypothetical protein
MFNVFSSCSHMLIFNLKYFLFIIYLLPTVYSNWSFNGYSPPNAFIVTTQNNNRRINSSLTWNSSTNLDILYFREGDNIGYSQTYKACSCNTSGSS